MFFEYYYTIKGFGAFLRFASAEQLPIFQKVNYPIPIFVEFNVQVLFFFVFVNVILMHMLFSLIITGKILSL